jgi:hypothetical protein
MRAKPLGGMRSVPRKAAMMSRGNPQLRNRSAPFAAHDDRTPDIPEHIHEELGHEPQEHSQSISCFWQFGFARGLLGLVLSPADER